MNYTQPEKDSIAIWLREGDSASQIAPKLSAQRGSPVTRNAIIGVVHRDKALAAIGFDRGNKARAGERSKPRRATSIRRAKGTAPGQLPGRLFLAAVDGEDRAGEGFYDLKAPTVRVPVPSHQPHFVAMRFIDCLFDRCRAPLSSDLEEKPGPDMLCCGHKVTDGKSYCTYHETRLCDRRHEYRAEAVAA
jgi:GcrA cell cycle regulator